MSNTHTSVGDTYAQGPPADLQVLLSRNGPLEWPEDLFPYQATGTQALLANDCLLLADDMGLGKTVQAIAALRVLVLANPQIAALVVAPVGLIVQWRRAIHHWAPELKVSTVVGPPSDRALKWRAPAHVHLVGYETLRADYTENPQSPPRRRVWDVVILDEAQKIKNRDTEVSQTTKRLPRRRVWALTGTPLENRVDDLASICEFLTPWEEGQRIRTLYPGQELYDRHRQLQLRRKKRDVLPQLPEKTVAEVMVELGPRQRETYDDAEKRGIRHIRELGTTATITHVLELIQRLKQICNFCSVSGASAKLDDVRNRLVTLVAEGHRALVFTQYTDPSFGVAALDEKLAAFNPLTYSGRLSTAMRDRVVSRFKTQDEHKILILSLRAGGQGLNLQEASYVFHFDRWWNPAVEHQAEDRSHRLGQQYPVTVYKYLCENTIEERIDTILRQKQALFDEHVDDVSIDLARGLTSEELFGLIGLPAPPAAARSGR